MKADIVDEHCYARPDWFFDHTHRYDSYDRNGPKVFFGEYAAQSDKVVSVKNRNNLACAIAEAAFMTGLERNADVVHMASYAPLFAHTEGWQWTPNLIWVDNLRSYGTPNYYVQKMFANHRGDVVLPAKLQAGAVGRLFASASREDSTGEIIVKIVNGGANAVELKITVAGLAKKPSAARALVLTSGSLTDENSLADPVKVAPVPQAVKVSGGMLQHTCPGNSFTVLRVAGNS